MCLQYFDQQLSYKAQGKVFEIPLRCEDLFPLAVYSIAIGPAMAEEMKRLLITKRDQMVFYMKAKLEDPKDLFYMSLVQDTIDRQPLEVSYQEET